MKGITQARTRELKCTLHPRPLFRDLLCVTGHVLPFSTVGSTTRYKPCWLNCYLINRIDRGNQVAPLLEPASSRCVCRNAKALMLMAVYPIVVINKTCTFKVYEDA